MDDLAFARALASGDEAAFHHLIDLESAAVLRLCVRILGRMDEAEDAAQESFVLAYRALGSYRADGPPGAWLARIATRVCWRRAGQTSRRRSVTTSLDGPRATEIVGPDDPSDDVLRAERAVAVRAAVARLPEPYREIVTLRFFSERSTEEIAAVTGRPEPTVRTQLRRGLLRLRESLPRDSR